MEVVGRSDELQAIDAWLDGVPEDVLLLEGEAGIGKTTLWSATVDKAAAHGYRVLRARAAQTEAQLAFAVLRDLLDETFDEIADGLPGPQREALAVTLLRESPRDAPPDHGAIGVALLSTLRALGASGPTLVAVDEAQWIDTASAGALAYALRRLGTAGVAVLLAQRDGSDPRLLSSLPAARLRTVTLGPMSMGALARILHEHLGTAYSRPALHRISETSGGNPFYALELARAFAEHRHPLGPAAALPVPPTLHELVASRLVALPRATREVLLVAAALARPGLDTVERCLGRDPRVPLEPAIRAHVASVERDTVDFAHPLYAAAVYGLATEGERQELHRRLAAILSDTEECARHLALSARGPDATIADALEHAAAEARVRIASAELYEAATRFTPPSDVEARARRTLAGAAAMFDAGDAERARQSLLALVEETRDGGAIHIDAQLLLGRILADVGSATDAMALWKDALEATDDDGRVADIRSCMVTIALYAGRPGEALDHARAAVIAAEGSQDTARIAYALAAQAAASLAVGDPSYRRFLRKALDLERGHDLRGSAWDWSPSDVAAACALRTFDLEEMRDRFGTLYDKGQAEGNVDLEQYGAYGLAIAALAAGEIRRADELTTIVEELVGVTGSMQRPSQRLRAEIDAHVGDVERARTTLSAIAEDSEARGEKRYAWQARVALGALELAQGAAAVAAAELRAARAIAAEVDMREPWVLTSLVDEVEAATEANLEAQARDARAAASHLASSTWHKPLLQRADAVQRMHAGELEQAEALLESALTVDTLSRLPVQHARTALTLGRVQRRARKLRAARTTLGEALEEFERSGASLWAARAREEIARIGGRTRSPGRLTPGEERVAALVVEGRSNKQVASELVVSVHTVESALTSIYRKLDVHSRTEMAHKLAELTTSKH
jgi:DNA-binding CsgD family transcriptional regulator